MALLRELPVLEGSVAVRGSVAYAAQLPWVFSATVQQNILFGQPFDKEKYERAIRAAALVRVSHVMLLSSC
jgi:ABC-type multidrug transport system fused ATPase/permease subunit